MNALSVISIAGITYQVDPQRGLVPLASGYRPIDFNAIPSAQWPEVYQAMHPVHTVLDSSLPE